MSGEVNQAGAPNASLAIQRALALDKFSGLVLKAYNERQVTRDKHRVHKVTEGKSHSWPEIWKTVAQQHFPGAEIDGNIIQHGERVISVDDLDISPVFVADIDKAIMHYDASKEYSFQLGQALANLNDKNVFRMMAKAAVSIPGGDELDPGGNEKDGNIITNADIGGTAMQSSRADLTEALYLAAQTLDERDIPDNDDRNIFVAPTHYYLLISAGTDIVQSIVNRDAGGVGSVQEADLRRIAAMNLYRSNNLRQMAEYGDEPTTPPPGVATKYLFDWRNFVALVNTPDSVGTVELIGMQSQAEYSVRHQGWLLVARKANGHGILRPEASVLLRSATPV